MKRVREPYLPETVKQALASAKRLQKQLYNAQMASPLDSKLWSRLAVMRAQTCGVADELRSKTLSMARKDTER